MRISQQAFDAFFLGAGIGTGIGALVTYWIATWEKRTISKIRQGIVFLIDRHSLTPGQYRIASNSKALASSEECLDYYRWSLEILHKDRQEARTFKPRSKWNNYPTRKISPALISAEGIICEKVLGLSRWEGLRALIRCEKSANYSDHLRSLGQPQSN